MDLRNLCDLHQAMTRAIDDELRVAPAPIGLPIGQRVALRGGHATYAFTMITPIRARTDAEVGLRFGDVAVRAEVVSARGDQLALRVARDFGPETAAGGVLILDKGCTLLAARRALDDALEGRRPFSQDFALQAIGMRPLDRQLAPVSDALAGVLATVAEEKGLAVRAALGTRGVSALWGPPGTGKTTTLALGVLAHVRHVLDRRQVLVVGPTNDAVDVAVSRVVECLREHGALAEGEVIRAGSGVTASFRERYGEQHVLDDLVARRVRERGTMVDVLSAELADAEGKLADIRCRDADESEGRRAPSAANADEGALVARVRALGTDVRRAMRLASPAVVRQELIDDCRVLGTTIHSALLTGAISRRQWSVVVCDESSMVPALYLYLVASLASESAWVAGDWLQLSPIVRARTEESRRWLASSPFDAMRCYREGADGRIVAAPAVSVLREQYRSRSR